LGHVAYSEVGMHTGFWLKIASQVGLCSMELGTLKGRDHSEDQGIDGNAVLEWTFGKLCGKVWTGCISHDG